LLSTSVIAVACDLVQRHSRLLAFLQRRRLQEALAYQDNLVARVSHELRTPLNVVLGYTEVLNAELVEQHPQHRVTFERMIENAENLSRLIGELLTLSQLRAGAVVAEQRGVDLSELV